MVRVIACPIGQDIGKSGESRFGHSGKGEISAKAREDHWEGVTAREKLRDELSE